MPDPVAGVGLPPVPNCAVETPMKTGVIRTDADNARMACRCICLTHARVIACVHWTICPGRRKLLKVPARHSAYSSAGGTFVRRGIRFLWRKFVPKPWWPHRHHDHNLRATTKRPEFERPELYPLLATQGPEGGFPTIVRAQNCNSGGSILHIGSSWSETVALAQSSVSHAEELLVGVKTWMLVYASTRVGDALRGNPLLDRDATQRLATSLFPRDKLEPIGEGDLSYTCPPDNELHIGCFPDVSIVAAKEFGIDYPSKLHSSFISAESNRTIYLHAMHSVVDWLAFAKWVDGKLVRSLSVSPDNGILEDIGQRFTFEEPFWSGQNPVTTDGEDEYPLPFHPLELGEEALKEFFGYQLEGPSGAALLQPESIPLVKYKRKKSLWKLW